MALPPYYVGAPEEGLFAYYEAIGRATDLPLMIYSRDWAVFTPEMVARLAERVSNLVAWKDGQGDVRRLQRIMEYNRDRLAWFGGLGDDCVPGYFAIGVQAYTSSISNIAPKISLALAEAGMAGDFRRVNELMHRYVNPLYALRERSRGYEVAMMKAAMEMLGMPAGSVKAATDGLQAEGPERSGETGEGSIESSPAKRLDRLLRKHAGRFGSGSGEGQFQADLHFDTEACGFDALCNPACRKRKLSSELVHRRSLFVIGVEAKWQVLIKQVVVQNVSGHNQ